MLRISFISAVFTVILAFYAIDNVNGKFVYKVTEEGEKENIIGGFKTYIFEHPYQVLLTNGDYICGGTILTEFHILTAAHCVYGKKGNYVVSGVSKVTLEQGIKVEEVWLHPEYSNQTTANNIAVLKLSSPIKFDESRQPAQLPTQNVKMGDVANVTGYGAESNGVEIPDRQLKVAKMQVWNRRYCKFLAGEYKICAFNQPGTGLCVGDGGGPLAIGNTVVGVVSHAFATCASGLPEVFSNVYKYLPFINKIITKSSG